MVVVSLKYNSEFVFGDKSADGLVLNMQQATNLVDGSYKICAQW